MVIDAHTHMPSPGWAGHDCSYKTVDAAVKHLQDAGIDRAVFNTWQGVFAETEGDLDKANSDALMLYEKFDGFLYPGTVIHPNFPETSIKWLDTFRGEGFMWVGELVQYKCNLEFDQLAWLKLFEYCSANGHIVQLHNSESIINVAKTLPELKIICSHINLALLEGFAQHDNVWLDMSGRCGGFSEGVIETALEAFGPDRILFGTDFTGYEPTVFINRVENAIKDKTIKEKLYSTNIISLLKTIGSQPII